MKDELMRRSEGLAKHFFGDRSLERLIRAAEAQVRSMRDLPTATNVHKQVGDLLFVLVDLARVNGWELEVLLEDRVRELEDRRRRRHYYEAHVTVNPVFGEDLERFKAVAQEYDFHVATLLMQKRPVDTPELSRNDSFCTGRGVSHDELQTRMYGLVTALAAAGFMVIRHKTEETLTDSRYDDSLCPLDRGSLPDKERNPRAPADGALPGRSER